MWYPNTREGPRLLPLPASGLKALEGISAIRLSNISKGGSGMANTARQPVRDDEILLRHDQGPVTLLTLNRPGARNSLSRELIAAVTGAMRAIADTDAIRAVVLTGAGSAFTSGHDLKELTAHRNDRDKGRAFFAETMGACAEMMLAIVHSPKAVSGAVNGVATAAGWRVVAGGG